MQVVVVNSATSKYKCQQSLENIGTLCHTYSSSWCKLMTYTSAQGTEYDMAWYATKQDYKKKIKKTQHVCCPTHHSKCPRQTLKLGRERNLQHMYFGQKGRKN